MNIGFGDKVEIGDKVLIYGYKYRKSMPTCLAEGIVERMADNNMLFVKYLLPEHIVKITMRKTTHGWFKYFTFIRTATLNENKWKYREFVTKKAV